MVKTVERWPWAWFLPTLALVGCNAILGLGDPTVDGDAGATTGTTGTATTGTATMGAGAGGAAGSDVSTGAAGSPAVTEAGVAGAGGSPATIEAGAAGAAGSQGAAGSGYAGGSADAGVDLSRFIGTWQTSTGTTTLSNCSNGLSYAPTSISATITVTRGSSSDLVMTDLAGCSLRANVSGTTAVFASGQICSTTSNNTDETDSFSTGSGFVLAANGATAQMYLVGDGTATNGTSTLSCTFQNYLPLTKL